MIDEEPLLAVYSLQHDVWLLKNKDDHEDLDTLGGWRWSNRFKSVFTSMYEVSCYFVERGIPPDVAIVTPVYPNNTDKGCEYVADFTRSTPIDMEFINGYCTNCYLEFSEGRYVLRE